ncbi:MAG: sterol desaturase family protein [Rhodospirillales bacterium]|nr:sterol desaturase family protein [Rhodospirillales bacterium]
MTDNLLGHETAIRLGFFFAVLTAMAAWEALVPRRRLSQPKMLRWTGNLGIVAVNTLIVRALFPAVPVTAALIAADRGWGVFNMVAVPDWLAVAASVVLLDLAIYGQHVMFHAVPAFWRLHRMHHADLDFDVTTGIRFHPLEIVLSVFIKMAAIIVLGAPAVAVLIFEVLLNATSMFNHGNVSLPAAFDWVLRWVVVTPDMHRVHHSVIRTETDSNFGFNLTWWDRLFGTYRRQPEKGHDAMTIGLPVFRDPKWLRLDRLVIQPFVDPPLPAAGP